MRTKVKMTSGEELLKNFTREFLIEEKKRCEIDRYVTDFRILIHNMPHENHNYLNRLLQDYTSMFLSHERISVNKSNEGEMKHRLVKQLASRMKESPKQRYVKSKLSSKISENCERQSYLILKARTEEFLQKLRTYEKLEQIAHEIFVKHSNNEFATKITSSTSGQHILKLKTKECSLDIPHEKKYKHVYVVNSPETKHYNQVSPDDKTNVKSSKFSTVPTKNLLTNYEYIKNETVHFLKNNRDYNDAEQKKLFEQYQQNFYIRKYVDDLRSSNENDTKPLVSPKRGFFHKIKNIMKSSPESTAKLHKDKEEEIPVFKKETKEFLKNEKKFIDFEFGGYKLFYMKNREFRQPSIESSRNLAYENTTPIKKDVLLKEAPDKEKMKIKSKNSAPLKNLTTENKQESVEIMEKIEFTFDPSPKKTEEGNVFGNKSAIISPETNVQFVTDKINPEKINSNHKDRELKGQNSTISREQTREFLQQQQIYENQQRKFHIIFLEKHPPNLILKANNKKESLLNRIKHLFRFGKSDKSKEKLYYFKKLTHEFLKNEKHYCDQERTVLQIPNHPFNTQEDNLHIRKAHDSSRNNKENELKTLSPKDTKQDSKFIISPSILHQRSRSEDLLSLKANRKSLDYADRRSPTGHKSFSDRLKRMVGIGNRRKNKSRENISRLTDPVQYFLDHERFYYDVDVENSKIYSRSVSLISQSGKKGTIKTKTRNFLSTENILYQDQNHRINSKPPSGRRRQESRSDGNKRRSRTLSPAQKLVSKFKNIVHRDSKRQESEKENWEFLRNETEKFISDQKYFNDFLRGESMEAYSSNSYTTISQYPKKSVSNTGMENKMNKTISSTQKITPESLSHTEIIEKHKIEQEESKSDNLTLLTDKKQSNAEKQPESSKKVQNMKIPKLRQHEVGYKSKIKVAEVHDNKKAILGNPGLLRKQTEIFLHDMKKYHDLDRGTSDVNKTLIFVNNKSSTPSKVFETRDPRGTIAERIERPQKYNASMKSEKKQKNFTNVSDEKPPIISKSLTSEKIEKTNNVQNENNEFSEQSFDNGVLSKTFRKETKVITRKVVSEIIHEKSSTRFDLNDKQPIGKKVGDYSEHKEVPNLSRNDVLLDNVISHRFEDKSKAIYYEQNKGHLKDQTIRYIKNEKDNSGETEKVTSRFGKFQEEIFFNPKGENLIESGANETIIREIIPSLSENQPQYHEKKITVPTVSNISEPQEKDIHKNQLKFDKANSALLETNLDEEYIPQAVTILPKNQPGKMKYEKTETELKSWITDTTKYNTGNNTPVKTQNNVFIPELKEQNNKEKEVLSKSNIVSLSEQDSVRNTQNEIRNTQNSDKVITASSDHKTDLEAFLLIKQKSSAFLKEQQDYHNRQSNEDNDFFRTKSNIIWLSDREIIPVELEETLSNKISRNVNKSNNGKHQHQEQLNLLMKQEDEKKNNAQKTNNELTAVPQEKYGEAAHPTQTVKVKKNTLSKLKSMVRGNTKQPHTNHNTESIRRQTAEFLERLRQYNTSQCEDYSKYRIIWLSEGETFPEKINKGLLKKTGKESKECNTKIIDEEKNAKSYLLKKQQTSTFLKDIQDYNNKQFSENINSLKVGGMSDKSLSLSLNNANNKNITYSMNKLSSTTSKKISNFTKDETSQVLKDQTAALLSKQQYLVHQEESNIQAASNSSNSFVEESNMVSQESHKDDKIIDQKLPIKPGKVKKSTFSRIKYLMGGSSNQPLIKESDKLIRKQNAEFLEHLKKYNNTQNETLSKSNIFWLRERKENSQEFDHVYQKKVIRHITKENIEKVDDEEFKLHLLMIQQTDSFLEDHKDYHNKERNEKQHFLQKIGIPEEKIWLSSNVSEKKSLSSNIKKLLSPASSKKCPVISYDKNHQLLIDRTAEFLRKHQYHIHKEDINPLVISNTSKKTVREETYPSKITTTQSVAPKDVSPVKMQKVKKSTLSNIKSVFSGTPKETSLKESDKFIILQTAEFLKQLRKFNNTEYETSSKSKVYWLSEQKRIPQNLDTVTQKKIPRNIVKVRRSEMGGNSHESHRLLKQKTDMFLKDHKNYHDKLKNEQYFIQKEEVVPKCISNPTNTNVKELASFSKITTSQSAANKNDYGKEYSIKTSKSTFSKIKSMMSGSAKEAPFIYNDELMRKQAGEFLEHLRKYNNTECETSSKFKVDWLSERKLNPQKFDDVIRKKIPESMKERSCVKNDREYDSYLELKKETLTFLKEHRNYHDKQRNEHENFFRKAGIPEEKFWLPFNITRNENLKGKMKFFSPAGSDKGPIISFNKSNQVLRDQTAEFLNKHQYLIHGEEVNREIISSPSYITDKKVNTQSNISSRQSALLKEEDGNKSANRSEKAKKSTLSKIKSLIAGTPKQPPIEGNEKLLSEHEIMTQKPYEEIPKNVIKVRSNKGDNQEGQVSSLMKQQTHNFLKDHKDYHDKQRNEGKGIISKPGDIIVKEVSGLSMVTSSEPATSQVKARKEPATKTDKAKKSKCSNIKYNMGEPPMQLPTKKNDKLISEQASEFLEHLRSYNNTEYAAFSKFKIDWLSEREMISQKVDEIIPEETVRKVIKKNTNKEKDQKYQPYLYLKEQTQTFLKDHKDYHDNNSNEHKKFFQKSGIPEEQLWLSSNISKSKSLTSKIKKLISPASSRKGVITTHDKNYQLLRDQTEEFLRKHQYFIHVEEINLKVISKPFKTTVKEDADTLKITKIQSVTPRDVSEIESPATLTSKMKKLLSPSHSKKSLVNSSNKRNQLLRDQTDEFLKKHQYLIHVEEVNPKIISNISDINVKKVTSLPLASSALSANSREETDKKSSTKADKAKKSTFSKIKSLVSGTAKQPPIVKENYKLIGQLTAEFLEQLRIYNNSEYETSSKLKISWLSDSEIIAQNLVELYQKDLQKQMKNIRNHTEEDSDYKSHLFIKRQTSIFLKDHKDYHDKQRIEDNNFLKKSAIPEEKLWLSSNISKNHSLTGKIKKLLSPGSSKRHQVISSDKNYQLSKDSTAEFLRKHQYFIHKDELYFKIISNPSDENFKKVTALSNTTAGNSETLIDKSVQVPLTKTEKTKKSTFSRIKSLLGSTAKETLIKENDRVICQRTAEFLEHLRTYNNIEYEASKKSNIKWLNQREVMSDKIDGTLQKTVQNNFTKNQETREYKVESNSEKSKKKENQSDNQHQLLGIRDSKKILVQNNGERSQILRKQTEEFLLKEHYLIHEEERSTGKISEPINIDVENRIIVQKIPVDLTKVTNDIFIEQSPSEAERAKESSLSKMKYLINPKSKQSTTEEKDKLLRKQTAEFLEYLKVYNAPNPLKYDIQWISERDKNPQKIYKPLLVTVPTKINRKGAYKEEDRQIFIIMKRDTNKFLKDHKDYHDRLRNEDNKIFKRKVTPDHEICLAPTQPTHEQPTVPKLEDLEAQADESNTGIRTSSTNNCFVADSTESFPSDETTKLMRWKTDEFLKNMKEYHNFQRESLTPNSVSIEKKVEKTNIIMKLKQLFSSSKPLNQNAVFYDDEAERNQYLSKLTSSFLKNELYFIYEEEINFEQKQPKLISSKLEREEIVIPKQCEKQLSLPTLSPEYLEGKKSDFKSMNTTAKIAPEKEVLTSNQSTQLLKHLKESSDTNENVHQLITNQLEQPTIMKKKVTFLDNQTIPQTVTHQTQQFLKQHQDYHDDQWNGYKEFDLQHNKEVRESTPSVAPKNSPVLSKLKNVLASDRPQKRKTSYERQVFKVTRDLSEEFLKKQQYLIYEDEIIQKSKPKPTPRKLKNISKTKNEGQFENDSRSFEEYGMIRNSLLLFLQDHQTYHNRERNEIINFANHQIEYPKNSLKKPSAKDQKSKFKLMSRLKSLVGGSTDMFSSEKKIKTDNAESKKQTMEFLISQKCFWDLEGSAALKFRETKQGLENFNNKGTVEKIELKKELIEKSFTPEKKKVAKKEKLPTELGDKVSNDLIIQKSNDKHENKDYEFLKKENQLFLNNHQIYHDNQMNDFIAFSTPRKQLRDECHNVDNDNQNTKPQTSSGHQKTLEMDNSTGKKSQSKSWASIKKQKKETIVDPKGIQNICEEFLNRQRCYIDSENEKWRRYIMFKPEVMMLKMNSLKNKEPHAKKEISSLLKTPKVNSQYSKIESEKIDYEVILHKTKLFLENHKNYHDSLQNEIANYVPKKFYRNDSSTHLTRAKKEGVLHKIKTMLPSGHGKNSYNIQKAELVTQNEKNIKVGDEYPSVTNIAETPKCLVYSNENERILRERTIMFLKDHQEYHNRQKNDFTQYFGDNHQAGKKGFSEEDYAKNKKTKIGMMSKLKSLWGTDSIKKTENKKNSDDIHLKKHTEIFLEDEKHVDPTEKSTENNCNDSGAKFEIKKLDSSPTNHRRNGSEKLLKNAQKDTPITKKPEHVEPRNDEQHEKNGGRKDSFTNETFVNPEKICVNQKKEFSTSISRTDKNNLQKAQITDKTPIESSYTTLNSDKLSDRNIFKKLSCSEMSNISEDERRKYAREKLQTHEFLLNQKEFAYAVGLSASFSGVNQYLNESSKPLKSADHEHRSSQNMEKNKITETEIENGGTVPKSSINISQKVVTNEKRKIIPSAPSLDLCEKLTEEEEKNIEASLVQRVVSPMSPTKTIFKEIRTRDNGRENRVYILSEGYTITKEGIENDEMKNKCIRNIEKPMEQSELKQRFSSKINEDISLSIDIPKTQSGALHDRIRRQKNIISSTPSFKSSDEFMDVHRPYADTQNFLDGERYHQSLLSTGQDCTSSNNEYSPSQQRKQGDLEVRSQYTKSWLLILLIVLVILIAIYLGREDDDEKY